MPEIAADMPPVESSSHRFSYPVSYPVSHPVSHLELYRLPWSLTDNVIAWLEPTAKCNLACEGCYRRNVDQHKSLDEVRAELKQFRAQRKFDGVSIAGGDPLLHPQVVEIVRMVAEAGEKPVINTNGHALTRDLLSRLRQAGLAGITFHIDSHQGRPGWRNRSETELCELRLQLAEWVAEEGGMTCAFNSTVYEDTLDQVPDLVAWAGRHIDLVHTMVFITYREADTARFDYYRGASKVEPEPLVYAGSPKRQRADISSREVVERIQQRFPDFAPSAYLGGTEKPDSLKWLMTARIGTRDRVFGYLGPRAMEVAQTAHHLATGRYFAYARKATLQAGRSSLLAAAAIDAGARAGLGEWARWVAGNPLRALAPMHVQAIMCIQPIDLLPDGRQNMCDACPDITVHNGELVWSCRLDEQLQFGGQLRTVPRASGLPSCAEPCGGARLS